MTTYMLMLPDDYDAWEAMTPQQRSAVYAQHDAFAARLEQGGHRMLDGGELAVPRDARTVRADAAGITVVDGPYAEAVEQISGFYLIESDDLADLEQASALIAERFPVEIRRVGRAVLDVELADAATEVAS